jgi:hypothetical protein
MLLSSVFREGAKDSYDASWLVDYDKVAILVMEEQFHRGGGYGRLVPMYRVSIHMFPTRNEHSDKTKVSKKRTRDNRAP